MIGDLFIGTLNNLNGRAALKEKVTEFVSKRAAAATVSPGRST
jgi:hypothetical protein